jgi:hypothetical protein
VVLGFRLVLGIGGVIDAFAGLALVLFPAPIADAMGVPVPADLYYVRLFGIAASSLGVLFALAALDPTRYRAVIYAAAGMRLGAALLLVTGLLEHTIHPAFSAFLPVEGTAAVLHVAYAAWLLLGCGACLDRRALA